MIQTQFSSYPASSIKLAELADFSPKHLDATTIDVTTKNSTIEAETSKEYTATKNSIIETETSKESTVDDVVVIPAQEFKSSKSSNKKYKSSESDLDSEDEVNKKYKSKKDEKESERSRERKKHRYRRKSRSITKSRSRTRSRSRNSRRTTLKEGRRSRSRSIHFREKIRNTSRSPVKGSKRARSPSLTRRRKPPTQFSSSHVSPNKRFQSSQKSRSRSPAVVQEANFALSQEIFSIIEKLQEAKTETAPNNPPSKEETPPTKDKAATKDEVPNKAKTEKVEKLPKNIVANYSSEFEEISDEEMTLAEDCLNELDDTKNEYETKSYIRHKKETEKFVKEKFDVESAAKGELNTATDIKVPTEDTSKNADGALSVFWNLNCSCCGANLNGSPIEDDQHYEDGECKKKSDWLKQGLPLICAYCSQSGSHWVAACPLLASFCFTCWTWGHSMDTHMVKKEEEGEKYIAS